MRRQREVSKTVRHALLPKKKQMHTCRHKQACTHKWENNSSGSFLFQHLCAEMAAHLHTQLASGHHHQQLGALHCSL